MNITQKNTGDQTAIIKIELGIDDYMKQVDETLKDYQRKTVLPGFRPGKIPFSIINNKYRKATIAEEVNKKISESLNDYILKNKNKFIGDPLPNTEKNSQINLDEQTNFEFYFDIGLIPEFELNLPDIEVDNYNISIDDNTIKDYIKDICKKHGNLISQEQIEEGNLIKGEFVELDEKANIKENGIKKDSIFLLDFIKLKSVKENFIGLKIGDKLTFNPLKTTGNVTETASMLNIKKEEAENLKSDFQFTINEIQSIEPVPVNNELYKKVYPNKKIENNEQFKEEIKKDLSNAYNNETDNFFLNCIYEKLIDTINITFPDNFLKRWLLETNKGKITKEQIDVQYDDYAKSLRNQIIINRIITENNLEINESDIKEHIKSVFNKNYLQNGNDVEEANKQMDSIVDSVMENKDNKDKIYNQLYDKRLKDFFKKTLKINNKEVTNIDFVKIINEKN
ncbi:MAG: hypothetical protein K8R58_01035 [Bacteroidales bacterium]|nr:hypothetical protein [Bacteroidales bacterium]